MELFIDHEVVISTFGLGTSSLLDYLVVVFMGRALFYPVLAAVPVVDFIGTFGGGTCVDIVLSAPSYLRGSCLYGDKWIMLQISRLYLEMNMSLSC